MQKCMILLLRKKMWKEKEPYIYEKVFAIYAGENAFIIIKVTKINEKLTSCFYL